MVFTVEQTVEQHLNAIAFEGDYSSLCAAFANTAANTLRRVRLDMEYNIDNYALADIFWDFGFAVKSVFNSIVYFPINIAASESGSPLEIGRVMNAHAMTDINNDAGLLLRLKGWRDVAAMVPQLEARDQYAAFAAFAEANGHYAIAKVIAYAGVARFPQPGAPENS